MNGRVSTFMCILLLLTCLLGLSGAQTTEVKIVKLAADGYTVLNETTVDYRWMEQHLPVKGDGSTHYYLQGPVFVDDQADRWNHAEDTNVKEKDMGAVKGTDLADLCTLVGGMSDEDEVTVRASDGFSRTFAYENVYNPSSRQGPIVISWYEGTVGYVPAYPDGMRLLFLADNSGNPWGIHALGVWDWHESADEKYWYYYYNGNERYPTTTGLSVRSVSEILIKSHEEPAGAIRVTSLPEGAHIFIDGEAASGRTPAEITGIPPGTYSVLVELEGYEVPEELFVEVEHQRVSEVQFDLVELPVDSIIGTADSSDSGDAGTGSESGTAGSALTLYMQGRLQGNVSVTPIPGLYGSMKGGDFRAFNLSGLPPGQDLLQNRLYIFSSNGTDHRNKLGVVPAFQVSIEGITISPDRVYQDRGANQTDGTVTTTAFTLPNVTFPGPPALTLHLADNPDIACMLEGGALITVSHRTNSSPVSYWIFEGADVIAAPPGTDRPDAETSAEFELNDTTPAYSRATLHIVSTRGRNELASGYQVQINGEVLSGIFNQSSGNIVTAEVPFPPPSPGSPVAAAFRAIINDTSGLYGETRLAVFILTGDANQIPVPPAVISGPAGTAESVRTSPSSIPSPSRISSETREEAVSSSPGDFPETKQESPISWLAPVTDWIDAILVLLFGEPAGPGTGDGSPGSGPAEYAGEAQSSPLPVTPAPVIPITEIFPDIPGELPSVSTAPGDRTSEVPGLPDENPDETYETPGRNRTRHGGVYVMSYPENVELRIDNKPIYAHLPTVVYGLKEGTHLIEVRLKSDMDRIVSVKSIRVWILADAITTARFDLVGTDVVQKVRVASENGNAESFTLDGYYPLRRTPADVEFPRQDSFLTVIRDTAYLTFTRTSITKAGTMEIPGEMPRLYRLRVESDPPGGDILIDGIRTGYQTPATVPNLSAGPHRVTVSLPGSLPGERVVLIPVDDGPDVKEPVCYVLETYPCGPLTIESIPGGASVSLDGINTGEKTPFTFAHIPLGIHEVTVTRNGESRKSDVVVKPDDSRRYIIMFEGNGTRPL